MSDSDPRHGMPPEDLLKFALESYPQAVALCDARTYYVESTRGGTPDKDATLTTKIPDVIAQSLRGRPQDARFRLLMISVPQWVEERASSRIVLPGEK